MTRYIAFLRAINVGGRVVKMDALRDLFSSLGLSNVETFIASGNVIFESRASAATLEKKIEASLESALGYPVSTFLRTGAEIHSIASHQPFPPDLMKEAPTLAVGFLAAPLNPAAAESLFALKTEFDHFHLHARELYWCSRAKQSESTFSNRVCERAILCPTTFRNLNTIARLAAKYPSTPR